MKRLAALRPYLRRHRRQLIVGIVSIFLSVAFSLFAPLIIGRAVDILRIAFERRTLVEYALLLIGVTAAQGIFSFLQRRVLVAMSRDIEFEMRDDYFRHLERMSAEFFQGRHTGDLMARGTNDLQAVRMMCGPAIMYSANTVFTAAGALFFMARIDVGLTVLSLCTLPLVAMSTKVFGQRIHALFERVQEQFSALSTHVQESLAGVRVIRAYAQEKTTIGRFERLNEEYVERNRRLIRWTAAFHPLLQGLIGLGFVAVLWYGGMQVAAEQITVGQFVSFLFFLSRMVWPMIAIGWVINLVQRGSASLARLLQVLEAESEVRDLPGCRDLPVDGAIAFRGLNFRYPNASAPALRDIDADIPPGSTVGVVGRTGAGKSTLLSLIPRLWEPPMGELLLDGVDIRQYCLDGLRQSIAMVPQETFLFSATLSDNIAFGKPLAREQEVLEVARIAGLAGDLELLPDGLETRIGERGVSLSGGQRQRVALARALLRRPQILLLDDCLSAVDTQTEEVILENLRHQFEGRTVFLVSHRISTVKNADMILVLDQGSIQESGRHEELLAARGIYADLFRRQQLEEELAAV